MSALAFLALFFTLFAIILGAPRAMNRRRAYPEEGTFAGLADELSQLDTTLGR